MSMLLALTLLLTATAGPRSAPHTSAARQEAEPATPWEDPEAVARGQRALEDLLRAAGGREAWQSVGGYTVQQLEVARVLTNRDTGEWKVHTYIPRLVGLTAAGDGWVYSEFMVQKPSETGPNGFPEFGPAYRREIRVGETAWAEEGGEFTRDAKPARLAQARVQREFFLACMPFSLDVLGARLAYLRSDENPPVASVPVASGGAPASALPLRYDIYLLQLPKPLILEETESQREFLLLVDPAASGGPRVVQLIYFLYEVDRDNFTVPSTQAFVDFEGQFELGALRLPASRWHWHAEGSKEYEFRMVQPVLGALAPESLRKPWIANGVYSMPQRADAFDPKPSGVHGGGGGR